MMTNYLMVETLVNSTNISHVPI